MRSRIVALLLAGAFACAPAAGRAQDAGGEPGGRAPGLAPLGAGPLHIASDAALDVEKIAIDVSIDEVSSTYWLKNKGAAPLDLAASFALPGLQAFSDDGKPWRLRGTAENPIGLVVAADGAPVAVTADVRALALGIDRRAEIAAAHLPLAPFDPQTAAALAKLDATTLAELAALGLVSPRDPSHAERAIVADWTLAALYHWRQPLPAGKTTALSLTYAPLKAAARYGADDALDLEDLKDEACLTPPTLHAAQALLKKAGALDVSEIALVNEPPMRWFESPTASLAVKKPRPDAVVGFCGMDAATAAQPVVRGSELAGADPRDFRILIFEPAAK